MGYYLSCKDPLSIYKSETKSPYFVDKTKMLPELFPLVETGNRHICLMIAGESVRANVEEYAATAMQLKTRDEIFSAMVVYGFPNYEEGKVRIPNRELMSEFERTIRRENSLGYVYRLATVSERMVSATLSGDTKVMEEIMEYAHDTESPILEYNREAELAAVVNLVYLSARDSYRVEREDKAGKGYVDFIFYPDRPGGGAVTDQPGCRDLRQMDHIR